ncbi:hypothetical protein ACFL5O_06180 [Myxococcota bacterium]
MPTSSDGAQVLAAVHGTVSLLSGRRSPVTDKEATLLDSLDPYSGSWVVMATAHDDSSPGAPESYAFDESYTDGLSGLWFWGVAGPAAPGERCGWRGLMSPRLQAWVEVSESELPGLLATVVTWAPDAGCSLLQTKAPSYYSCLQVPPLPVLSDGSAPCRLFVATDLDECPAELGWLSVTDRVVRQPGSGFDETSRWPLLCEVPQLTGEALQSCQHEFACTACEPGFCLTKVWDLVSNCAPELEAEPRIVAPADQATGVFQLQCE